MARLICKWLAALVVVGGALVPANGVGPADRAKTSAMAKDDYAKVFLTAKDLPGMKLAWDKRYESEEDDFVDATYKKLGGLRWGKVMWNVPDRAKVAPIHDLEDSRWVFPSAEGAGAFLKNRVATYYSKLPVVKTSKIGDETYAFGGIRMHSYNPTIDHRHCTIAFRQGNVVVEVYAKHYDLKAKLSPTTLGPLCQKIAERIKATAR